MNVNLIMPMAGEGSRFFKDGFFLPKPLIEINEKPFFYWATQSIRKFVKLKSLTFVILQDHIDKFNIDKEILKYFEEAKFVVIPKVLNGAVLTCLNGIKNIDDNEYIIFNDCDHLFLCEKFYKDIKLGELEKLDAALLTFKSNENKYSFVGFDKYGKISHTVEKQVISNDAICGTYCFKNKALFKNAAEIYLKNCNYKEFFISGIYNVMLEKDMNIKNYNLDQHISFGTPEEFYIAKPLPIFKEKDW